MIICNKKFHFSDWCWLLLLGLWLLLLCLWLLLCPWLFLLFLWLLLLCLWLLLLCSWLLPVSVTPPPGVCDSSSYVCDSFCVRDSSSCFCDSSSCVCDSSSCVRDSSLCPWLLLPVSVTPPPVFLTPPCERDSSSSCGTSAVSLGSGACGNATAEESAPSCEFPVAQTVVRGPVNGSPDVSTQVPTLMSRLRVRCI